jgi:hypothetical protein
MGVGLVQHVGLFTGGKAGNSILKGMRFAPGTGDVRGEDKSDLSRRRCLVTVIQIQRPSPADH